MISFILDPYEFLFFAAAVARMIKFYDMPLVTAGALTEDFTKPKTNATDEYHMLTRTGPSYSDISKLFVEFWKK